MSSATKEDCQNYVNDEFQKLLHDNSNRLIFNNFKLLKKNLPDANLDFKFSQISISSLIEVFNDLPNDCAAGQDGIPTKVLKDNIVRISPILANIFNKILSKRKIPDSLKFSITTAVYINKGDSTEIKTFCGISTISPVPKSFQKLVCIQMTCYFEVNRLFFAAQHSFRNNFSCESALHQLISEKIVIPASLTIYLQSVAVVDNFKLLL
jgi:hypothetical protein